MGDSVDDAGSSSRDDVEARLGEECSDLERQLSELKQAVQIARVPVLVADGDPVLTIYAEKERQLKAEIQVTKETDVDVNPDVFTEEAVVFELRQTVSQLKETLRCVQTRLTDLQKQVESHASIAAQQQQMQSALQTQLEAAARQRDMPSREDALLERLKDRNKKAVTHSRHLMTKLRCFIEENFPHPTEEDLETFRKKRRGSIGDKVIGLQEIIEMLLIKCVDCPHDPYIELNDTFWAPYVELLLRTCIAQRHPADVGRIKLTPFHL